MDLATLSTQIMARLRNPCNVIVRQVKRTDLDGLCKLAASSVITTLRDTNMLEKRLEHAISSFEKAGHSDAPQNDSIESYLFAMEDQQNMLVGISGIASKVPSFLKYKMSKEIKDSAHLDVRSNVQILKLETNDRGMTELNTLYAHPKTRGFGKLLSFSRLLYIAEYLEKFEDKVFVEIQGFATECGFSPFYDHCVKPFMKVDFVAAETLSCNSQHMQSLHCLLPKHPIYVDLLPKHVRGILGKPHKDSKRAKKLLEQQNFSTTGEIDVIEGGPVLACATEEIVAVRNSVGGEFRGDLIEDPKDALIAAFEPFRCCRGSAGIRIDGGINVDQHVVEKLELNIGDNIRLYFL